MELSCPELRLTLESCSATVHGHDIAVNVESNHRGFELHPESQSLVEQHLGNLNDAFAVRKAL